MQGALDKQSPLPGVVWCGVVWCGVVWCGVEHHDFRPLEQRLS
ncbi:hypothetical protein [Shewanella algae]